VEGGGRLASSGGGSGDRPVSSGGGGGGRPATRLRS
jgi:hypothetical protein